MTLSHLCGDEPSFMEDLAVDLRESAFDRISNVRYVHPRALAEEFDDVFVLASGPMSALQLLQLERISHWSSEARFHVPLLIAFN